MRKLNTVFFLCTAVGFSISAQNPISPPGVYIADPSAHVWDDKLYVYGSNDESRTYFCSWVHHVLSSSNLKNWELTPNAFSSKGKIDGVPYNDQILYAPDCQYKAGTYYLYYCQPGEESEGVATSQSPTGPFLNGKKIDTKGINQIDPCVFIDDDGQAYYIWGQFAAKIAKMKPNLTEIDFSTLKDSLVTEKEHFFHEGGYMVKRNGIYYFVYAHMGRANMPTCIGYATSRSPMGPFKYGGVIVDNNHCDPQNWNNHGSLVEFNGKWYVFYHRATHNSYTMRKACVEPIVFNNDGSINEVEMTSQGASGPLDATSKIEAEWACLLFGGTYIQAFSSNEEKLANMKAGNNVAYKYLEFKPEIKAVELRVKPGKKAGRIDFSEGQPWHAAFASVEIPEAKNENEWIVVRAEIKALTGVHALWLRYNTNSDSQIEIDWFRFIK